MLCEVTNASCHSIYIAATLTFHISSPPHSVMDISRLMLSSMLKTLAICALLLAGADAAPANHVAFAKPQGPDGNLTVNLDYAIYQGVKNNVTGLSVWRGFVNPLSPPPPTNSPRIRYAAPPTGLLRWKAPQTPSINLTLTPATTFGPSCPQTYPAVPNAPFILGNEDCLFLNVYAPPTSGKKLPVLVWIHGGGYGLGDGTQDMSEIINANKKGFLAVSIQYRVNIARGHVPVNQS